MATNKIQDGQTVSYTTGAAETVSSGDVVWVGAIPGVALVDIAVSSTGTVEVGGVWSLSKHYNATPANGTVFAVGDPVFWDSTNERACATAVFPLIGHCWEAATGDATTVSVKLDGHKTVIPVIAGEAIDAGELVYVSGYDAKGYLKVKLADADAAVPANAAIWVAGEDIENAAIGAVTDAYLLTAQNTDSASAVGDPVYLSDTAGGWVLSAHTTGGDTVQQVGVVTVKSATIGQVLLCPGLFKATTVNTTS